MFTEEDLSDVPNCERRALNSELSNIEISADNVCKRLSALNPNKSSGPDGFHPRILKEFAYEPLALVFQKSLQESVLPSDWKEAQVTPLFKKGEKDKP